MNSLKQLAKKTPVLPSLYRLLVKSKDYFQLKSKSAEQVFDSIYKKNTWGGKESASGTGSDAYQTRNIVPLIPSVIREYDIATMLDIPCGDFNWMRNVDLTPVDYIGADIVDGLIDNNRANFAKSNVHFQKLDIIKSPLPKVDLVFCRDCLVHLSFDDAFQALHNLCNSQSAYLLTTTFTERKKNSDILTGQWRTLNFELPPFNFPAPIQVFNEGCTEGGGAFQDKALGLWKISDIQKSLGKAIAK